MDFWTENGSTFTASRVSKDSEFLASTDNWFRPVFFYNGPDGSIYLVDYYREMIEHPEWASSNYHKDSEDLYRGTREGRIYKIYPQGKKPKSNLEKLSQESSHNLVSLLGHQNAWWRKTAQRLLVDRQAKEIQPELVELLTSSPLPLARLHALWTLEGLGLLAPEMVLTAFSDINPGVRENAVILSELFLDESNEVHKTILGLATDPSQRVRFQVLLTSGFLTSLEAQTIRDQLLFEGIEDPWVPIAALSASSDEAPRLLELAISHLAKKDSDGARLLFRMIGSVLGARQNKVEIVGLLTRIPRELSLDWWKSELLKGLIRGTRVSASTLFSEKDVQKQILEIFMDASAGLRQVALELVQLAGFPEDTHTSHLLKQAAMVAANPNLEPKLRNESIQLLGISKKTEYLSLFGELIKPTVPESIQVSAIQAIGLVGQEFNWRTLILSWKSFTPTVRNEAAKVFLKSSAGIDTLLNALDEGVIDPLSLAHRHKRRLFRNKDPLVRKRGQTLLDESEKSSQMVLERYNSIVSQKGDTEKGHEVYRRECSKCHQFRGEGKPVGPDLETIRSRPMPILLRDILLPSQAIAPQYQSYVIERISGGIDEGILKEQTQKALILVVENKKEIVIPRDDIRRFYISDLSAMPGDLENFVSVEEMAHLLQFLKTK